MLEGSSPLARAISHTLGRSVNRGATRIALVLGAFGFLFLGFCSGMIALWFALLPEIGPSRSALVLTAIFIALAAILALIMAMLSRSWARKAARAAARRETVMAGQGLAGLMLGIMALGFAAGRKEK